MRMRVLQKKDQKKKKSMSFPGIEPVTSWLGVSSYSDLTTQTFYLQFAREVRRIQANRNFSTQLPSVGLAQARPNH